MKERKATEESQLRQHAASNEPGAGCSGEPSAACTESGENDENGGSVSANPGVAGETETFAERMRREQDSAGAIWQEDASDEQLLAFAARRLISETFQVFAKGLNPSRFESWARGSRSRVARQYGAASDLLAATLSLSISEKRGFLTDYFLEWAQTLQPDDELDLFDLALVFYDSEFDNDSFQLQMLAWCAASDYPPLKDELNGLYDSLEKRGEAALDAILAISNRVPVEPATTRDVAAILVGLLEGMVIRGKVGNNEETRLRYARHAALMFENLTRPNPQGGRTPNEPETS